MKFGRIGPLLRNLTLKMPLLGTPENLLKITKTGSPGPDEAAIVLCKHAGIWAPVCYRRIAVPAPPIDQLLDPGGPELCLNFAREKNLLSIPTEKAEEAVKQEITRDGQKVISSREN